MWGSEWGLVLGPLEQWELKSVQLRDGPLLLSGPEVGRGFRDRGVGNQGHRIVVLDQGSPDTLKPLL